MMKHKQNGFAHLSVVLILAVVIGAIGFAGWKVSQKNAAAKTDSATAAKPAETTTTPTKSKASMSTPSSSQASAELTIKEWGVKIPLSSTDAGAYYDLDTVQQQDPANPTNLVVYSKETDALVGPTGKSCKGEYIANLVRLPADDPRWQPSQSVDDGNVSPTFFERFVIGKYRYALENHKQYGPECYETSTTGDYVPDTKTSQQFEAVINAFADDFKHIH